MTNLRCDRCGKKINPGDDAGGTPEFPVLCTACVGDPKAHAEPDVYAAAIEQEGV